MVAILGYACMAVGVTTFGVGYIRRNRNVMLLGTIVLMLGTGLSYFVKGFVEGFGGGWNAGG